MKKTITSIFLLFVILLFTNTNSWSTNIISKHIMKVTPYPPSFTSFIRWDGGGYTSITDFRLKIENEELTIKFEAPRKYKTSDENSDHVVVKMHQTENIVFFSFGSMQELRCAIVEIPRLINGVLVIVNSNETYKFASFHTKQKNTVSD